MNDSARPFLLDSFALLAYLEGEAGEERVKEIFRAASHEDSRILLSLISLGEVACIVEKERGLAKAQEVLAIIEQLSIEILPVSRQAVLEAAHIKANYPVAYADAFCIAAARAEGGILVTGDPEFEAVASIVQIEWLERG